MAKRAEIVDFLCSELELVGFPDHGINGLQIEGCPEVKKVAVAVDAGLAVVEEAISAGAQMLIVHHGIFWGEAKPVTGALRKLLKTILDADLNLLAAHLPLDSHLQYGNNAVLAEILDLKNITPYYPYQGKFLGCRGENTSGISRGEMCKRLSGLVGASKEIFSLDFGPEVPSAVGLLSGAGADALYRFEQDEIDTLVTGEPRQAAYHFAKENKLNALFAGHYATETLGVQELGKLLAKQFGIDWSFIDHPTGI